MNCREAKVLFSEFHDEELNQEISRAMKEHLASCRECKEEYEDLKKSVKILEKLTPLEAPRDYLEIARKH